MLVERLEDAATVSPLPLQFPVQAQYAWMYEADMPFPIPHSLLRAANFYGLTWSDIDILSDLADEHNMDNTAVNKCMLVRRAISFMDVGDMPDSPNDNPDGLCSACGIEWTTEWIPGDDDQWGGRGRSICHRCGHNHFELEFERCHHCSACFQCGQRSV